MIFADYSMAPQAGVIEGFATVSDSHSRKIGKYFNSSRKFNI